VQLQNQVEDFTHTMQEQTMMLTTNSEKTQILLTDNQRLNVENSKTYKIVEGAKELASLRTQLQTAGVQIESLEKEHAQT